MQLRSCLKKKRESTPRRGVSFGGNTTVSLSPTPWTEGSFFSEPDYQNAEAELEAQSMQQTSKRARVLTDPQEAPAERVPRSQPSRLPPLPQPTNAPAAPEAKENGPDRSPLRKVFGATSPVKPVRTALAPSQPGPAADAPSGNTRASERVNERLMEEIKGMTMPQLKNKIREVAARRRERERRARQMASRATGTAC